MFSSKPIYAELIRIISLRVGDFLSKQPNGTPNIVKAETDTSKRPYPFITIDRISTTDTASYKTSSYFDPNDNTLVSQVHKDITFILQLRSKSPDAYDQMNYLKMAFTLETFLESLSTNCGATVKSTTEVSKIPDPLSTTYQRIHTFNVTLTVIEEDREDLGYIEKVQVSGEVEGAPIEVETL